MASSTPSRTNGFGETCRAIETLGGPLTGILGGEVRHEVGLVVQRRKAPQQAANIHFVSGEMAADGMSINREAHQIFPW